MKHVSTFKAITLILVFCIADVYALADARKPTTSDGNAATNIGASKMLLGRLFVPYHQEILVNGRSAMSGDIVISGSRLQTSNAADPAHVDIGSIATLDIEPDTDLSLTFDQRSVEVKVFTGEATLNTNDGVKGEVIMPDGKVCPTTPQKPSPNHPPNKPPTPNEPPMPKNAKAGEWKEWLEIAAFLAAMEEAHRNKSKNRCPKNASAVRVCPGF